MFRPTYIYGLFLSLAVVLTACTPRSVREAQTVVTDADSLWHNGQMYGIDAGDSVTLAEAYHRLDRVQAIFPDEFAHSCYHYGRLLRKKDNPVDAMQAFLAATHSRTRDYHILGRVYSNMGDICHLAGEYNLSYDMFEKSAGMFLENGDTINYYYALNDMAFELAEQGKKDDTYNILNRIERECNQSEVQIKLLETKATACKKVHQYDSAIFYGHQLRWNNYYDATGLLICAQAYSYLNLKDSATLYANMVLERSNQLDDICNALYILTNDDKTKNIENVRQIAADRSDVQKLMEIRQGQLSQATQLLEIDLNRKPDWQWLYASCATIFILGILALIYLRRRHRQHQLLSQQVEDLENKSQEIMREHTTYKNNLVAQLEQNCRVISESKDFPDNLNWKEFEALCKTVDTHFNMLASKLSQAHALNETEIRLCVLVLLNLGRTQISTTLPYALNSIGKLKDHTAKKLGTTGKNLRSFLLKIAVE